MPQYIKAKPGVLAILARHGSTEANDTVKPQVRGWEDFPLDERGRLEAQLLANKLKKYDIKGITCSDFMRDSQTAQIISSVINCSNIEYDYDSRTWDVGTFSGQNLEDANPAIAMLYRRPWEKPPGSGESFDDFSRRFTNFLDKKLKLASIDDFRPQLIITHGKNIALTKTWIDGGAPWESIMPKPAGYAVISVGKDMGLYIEIIPPVENVIEDI